MAEQVEIPIIRCYIYIDQLEKQINTWLLRTIHTRTQITRQSFLQIPEEEMIYHVIESSLCS